jgi:hypothetical protein
MKLIRNFFAENFKLKLKPRVFLHVPQSSHYEHERNLVDQCGGER